MRFCILLLIAAQCAAVAHADQTSEQIPFKLALRFGIVVKGAIGPRNNLNFLIDTGAVPSVISEILAAQLGMTGPKSSYSMLDKSSSAEYVTADDVRFGWIHANRLPMIVLNLEQLGENLGLRIDAIVGLDIFAGQSFGIDYKHHWISPHLSGKTRHAVPVEINLSGTAPYWVLPVGLGGRMLRVLLDTGADNVTLFAESTTSHVTDMKLVFKRPVPVNGEFETRALQPSLLLIGDSSFRKQSVFQLQNPRDAAFPKIDGVLGPTALGITRIELDWENKCLRWDTK
jgi:predicted aspartyl protease